MEKATPEKFRKAREAAGLTQKEAAHTLGFDERTYQRWELGEVSRLRLSNLQTLRALKKKA